MLSSNGTNWEFWVFTPLLWWGIGSCCTYPAGLKATISLSPGVNLLFCCRFSSLWLRKFEHLKKKEDKMTINVHNPPCVWESSTWCQEDFPQLRYVSYVHTCNVSLAVLTEVVGFTQWSRDNNLSMGICLICRRKSELLKASSCLGGEGKGNMLRHVFFSLL